MSGRSYRRRGTAGLGVARAAARLRSDLPLAALDVVLVAGAYFAALFVRFDGVVPTEWSANFRVFVAGSLAVHLACNWMWGLYGQMWRHASIQEARRILLAGASSMAVLALLFLPAERNVPLSVLALGAAAATILIGILRFQSRLFAFRRGGARQAPRVVVIGAGESGAAIVREMLRSPESAPLPVAVLDDDPRKQGRSLNGVPIIGGVEALPHSVERYQAEQALLAVPSADRGLVRRVASSADAVGLSLKILPRVAELVDGEATMRDVRDLSIDDLLGRQQVVTDLEGVRGILSGRRVLITGAGGSIGSEIARQVAACRPQTLLLLDHDETHLYDAAGTVVGECTQLLADVRDAQLVDSVFTEHRPDVVFHAAAHKHVPLLEEHPCEALATNVSGTQNVVDAAARHGVGRFVFVSTDKAVHPSSVMGASKRLGEQILLSRAPAEAHYCAVRFGNVLGSRGSVIPTFVRQIKNGGPLTVTDPRMTRFFMSLEEAVQLVLQAAALSEGGEVFMLDMGEPVRIIDLAERMIRLSGRKVGIDVPIRIVGMRPGEKLAEELRTPDETPHATAHPSIVALYPGVLDPAVLEEGLRQLAYLAELRDDTAASGCLLDLATRQPSTVRLPDSAPTLTSHNDHRSLVWNRSNT